jgi:hypothetical protein
MMLMQKAGDIQLRTFTDGYPLRIELTVTDYRDNPPVTLDVDGLHDLRYCIDRLLAKVDEHEKRRR